MITAALTGKLQEQIDWYSFLSRPQLHSPSPEILGAFRGSSVLVTGAGGSIGSQLSLRLRDLGVKHLVLLEASEQSLYRLQISVSDPAKLDSVTFKLGSVLDEDLLQEIFSFYKFQFVFHAAAYKHVPLLEEHPLAAIQNNIFGTLAIARAVTKHRVPRLVLLSTDKAADPASILGATKRIAEQITLSVGGMALRLANVLGSEGSVVDSLLERTLAALPVLITDPEGARFFITCDEAVNLLLSSAATAPHGALLAPRLTTSHKIVDLAIYINSFFSNCKLSMSFTGLRPGDKLQETFCSAHGQMSYSDANECMTIYESGVDAETQQSLLPRLKHASDRRDHAEALRLVCELVPNYTPSAEIQSAARELPEICAARAAQ